MARRGDLPIYIEVDSVVEKVVMEWRRPRRIHLRLMHHAIVGVADSPARAHTSRPHGVHASCADLELDRSIEPKDLIDDVVCTARSPDPGADVVAVSPVLVQMWQE